MRKLILKKIKVHNPLKDANNNNLIAICCYHNSVATGFHRNILLFAILIPLLKSEAM